MFLLNIGYDLSSGADINNIEGAVVLPSKNYSYRLADLREFPKLFIDPQLYLSSLSVENCLTPCAHLATYSWFQVPDIEQLQEGENKPEYQKKIKEIVPKKWTARIPIDILASCTSAIEFQNAHKCSHIILPSPLITMREDEAAVQAQWLDTGLNAYQALDISKPVLASVALDEAVLSSTSYVPGGFLDTIVDQVSSRPGISGVYIVICQTHRRGPYQSSENVNRAYLYLAKKFANTGLENIIVNFADVFGITCISQGATLVAIGSGQSERNISLKSFEDGGGAAIPHFFSRHSICEYQSESDLKQIIKQSLWRRIEDQTEFSRPLVEAIRAGRDASTVPTWAEGKSNTAQAKKHFVKSVQNILHDLQNDGDRNAFIMNWLEDAEMIQTYIASKVDKHFPERAAPVSRWLSLLNDQ